LTYPLPDEVASCVRSISLGKATVDQVDLLVNLGLASPETKQLNSLGKAVEEAYWIHNRPEDAKGIISRAFLGLPASQALVQGLHGKGPIPIEGALYLLERHGLASSEDLTMLRGFLSTLNRLGIVAFSPQKQTVRIIVPPPLPEEEAPTLRVVQPDRPYSNVRHLREILRGCRDYIWWADPHFNRKGLEPLHDEADSTKIREIRILSGPAHATTADSKKDFARFKQEMTNLGIISEWRVVENQDRAWHDRFIVTKHRSWNVPPVNTLFKGDYSEAFSTTERPPFEDWWKRGVPVDLT